MILIVKDDRDDCMFASVRVCSAVHPMLSRVFMQLLFLWVLSMQNASTQSNSNCMFGVFSLLFPLRPLVVCQAHARAFGCRVFCSRQEVQRIRC